MLTIRAMSDGSGYASRHLENNDYYAEGEHVIGQWHGRGAEILGIAGEVTNQPLRGREPPFIEIRNFWFNGVQRVNIWCI